MWAEGMISPNLVQFVPCGLCLVHLVPCGLGLVQRAPCALCLVHLVPLVDYVLYILYLAHCTLYLACQLVPCVLCLVHLVPWTLHGCCGQGGSSHQIGPQLNTNLPRFKIFVDTNRTGNDKDKDRGVLWPNISLRIEVKSALLLGRGIFIFPVSSFVLKHIVEHFHISSVD